MGYIYNRLIAGRRTQNLVAVSSLFHREATVIQHSLVDKPYSVSFGQALQAKREEDFVLAVTSCARGTGGGDDDDDLASSTTFDAFGIFDGHNGSAAALFAKENLLHNVTSAVPPGLSSREEWLAALPRAMVAGFVKTDKDWQSKGKFSGTTATLVIVDGLTVTVACVGDSRCVLDAQGAVIALTIDHRLDTNDEERERVIASGGEVARMHHFAGPEAGPLRAWPGGICLSRTIGDLDAGDYIVPVPHVKQIRLSAGGGRLIIASDGVWDALSSEKTAKICRGEKHPEVAAKNVVKEAVKIQGLRDDTTCLVVDIVPPGRASRYFAPAVRKRMTVLKLSWFSRAKKSIDSEVPAMEELFEETSATLADRLGPMS